MRLSLPVVSIALLMVLNACSSSSSADARATLETATPVLVQLNRATNRASLENDDIVPMQMYGTKEVLALVPSSDLGAVRRLPYVQSVTDIRTPSNVVAFEKKSGGTVIVVPKGGGGGKQPNGGGGGGGKQPNGGGGGKQPNGGGGGKQPNGGGGGGGYTVNPSTGPVRHAPQCITTCGAMGNSGCVTVCR
jgi:hypothetical protein